MSPVEANTWKDFVSIFGNAIIAGDKLSILRPERFELLEQAFKQSPYEQCIPLDFWDGNADYIPGCYLCGNPEETTLYLFNWNDYPVEKSLEGFVDGEYLVDADGNTHLDATAGPLAIKIEAHSSKCLRYNGPRAFEELRYKLMPRNDDSKLIVESVVGTGFKFDGIPVEIPLGDNAQCPLNFDRLLSAGMLKGNCSEVIKEDKILGIPFSFTAAHKVIKLSSSAPPGKVRLDIGKKLKKLYILHCCEMPVKGYLNSYLFKYRDKTEETPVIVGEHIGNSSAEYSLPWRGANAKIAWHNPQNDACLYLMEWHNPYPGEVIEELEITWPQQKANVYIVGITGIHIT